MKRAIGLLAGLAIGTLIAHELPSLKRYFKIERM